MLQLADVRIGLYDGSAETFDLSNILEINFKRSMRSAMSELEFTLSTSNYGKAPCYGFTDIDIEAAKELLTPGNMCTLYINDRKQFTGYIVNTIRKATTITISARDILWRLNNTIMNHQRKALNPSSKIDKIVEFALDSCKDYDANGFPTDFDSFDWLASITIVYSQSSSLQKLTGKTPDVDLESDTTTIQDSDIKPKENETPYAFLKRLLTPWGYLLQATADGDLVIFRPNTTDYSRHKFVADMVGNKQYGANAAPIGSIPTLTQSIENVASNVFVFNTTMDKDSNSRRVKANLTNNEYPSEGPRCNHMMFDKDMKTIAACEKKAKRSLAQQLRDSWRYSFEINAFMLDDIVFSNDTVVSIIDEYNDVNEDVYVVGVEMKMSQGGAQSTTFDCCKTTALVLE